VVFCPDSGSPVRAAVAGFTTLAFNLSIFFPGEFYFFCSLLLLVFDVRYAVWSTPEPEGCGRTPAN